MTTIFRLIRLSVGGEVREKLYAGGSARQAGPSGPTKFGARNRGRDSNLGARLAGGHYLKSAGPGVRRVQGLLSRLPPSRKSSEGRDTSGTLKFESLTERRQAGAEVEVGPPSRTCLFTSRRRGTRFKRSPGRSGTHQIRESSAPRPHIRAGRAVDSPPRVLSAR